VSQQFIPHATATQKASQSQAHHGAILDGVQRRLSQSAYGQHRKIAFDFEEGVLTLRGIVSSYFIKQLAHVAVVGVAGVKVIANRLEVRYPAPPIYGV